MRKALFAVMLIGASFAGGAVVNGPGLRWAQDMILSHLNGDGEEDESSGTEETTASTDEAKSKSKSDDQEPPAQLLSAPLSLDEALASSRAANDKGATSEKDGKNDKTEATARHSDSETGSADAKTAAVDRSNPTAKAASSPSRTEESAASGALKLLGDAFRRKQPPADDGEVALAKVPTPLPDGATPPPLEPLDPLPPPNQLGSAPDPAAKADKTDNADNADKADKDKSLALAGASALGSPPPRSLEPAPETASGAAASSAPAASASTSRPASDWGEIRRKMATLGVSRYGIEGEPNGRVRFHCVIPLAGRRAVAQQFEAEGDDEFQAAEVALRRVALWRATENPGP